MHLASLHTDNDFFALVDLSLWPKLADLLELNLKEEKNQQILDQILNNLVKIYAGETSKSFDGASGLLLDPTLSLNKFLDFNLDQNIILALDKPQAEYDPIALPQLDNNWTADEIKNNYAVAHLNFHYHPSEEMALKKKQFLAEISDYCKYINIDFILNLKIYDYAGKKLEQAELNQAQLQAVSELQNLADLLVLEYPGDSLSCATLTTELDRPWLLADNFKSYDNFKNNLKDSLENGAKGFLASESLWVEILQMRNQDKSLNLEQILDFLVNQTQDRIIELSRIVSEY